MSPDYECFGDERCPCPACDPLPVSFEFERETDRLFAEAANREATDYLRATQFPYLDDDPAVGPSAVEVASWD